MIETEYLIDLTSRVPLGKNIPDYFNPLINLTRLAAVRLNYAKEIVPKPGDIAVTANIHLKGVPASSMNSGARYVMHDNRDGSVYHVVYAQKNITRSNEYRKDDHECRVVRLTSPSIQAALEDIVLFHGSVDLPKEITDGSLTLKYINSWWCVEDHNERFELKGKAVVSGTSSLVLDGLLDYFRK